MSELTMQSNQDLMNCFEKKQVIARHGLVFSTIFFASVLKMLARHDHYNKNGNFNEDDFLLFFISLLNIENSSYVFRFSLRSKLEKI